MQCITFLQETKIQSDLRDEESPQARKEPLRRPTSLQITQMRRFLGFF